MSIYLAYTSALQYWRFYCRSKIKRSRASSPFGSDATHACAKPSREDIDSLTRLMPTVLAPPFHLMVPNPASRRDDKRVVYHMCTTALPNNSFAQIAPSIFVASPELCFVQLATCMEFATYVQLGFELCGGYRFRWGNSGEMINADSLTSVLALEKYLKKVSRIRGARNARRALLYLGDGSKSPMETDIAILLCFPVRMGGYGLIKPLLNFRIDINTNTRSILPQTYFALDFYWPQASIGLEYDSCERHEATSAITHDAIRRNGIEHCGIRVVTMTKFQALNYIEFNRIALILSGQIGKRIRPTSTDWTQKNRELRRILFARFG